VTSSWLSVGNKVIGVATTCLRNLEMLGNFDSYLGNQSVVEFFFEGGKEQKTIPKFGFWFRSVVVIFG